MNEKKVIVVIVEGPSDENALGGILKEYFSSSEVQFAVVHGDITSDSKTSPENVVAKIKKLVDSVNAKYGYAWRDITRIIHIGDTDGAFTKNCVHKADVKNVQYYEDHIDASDVEVIEKRNRCKAKVLLTLYSTGKVRGIPYRIYFNSCNLEHVLYNQLKNFSGVEKVELADNFADKFEGKVQEFIDFISAPALAVPGTYRETWKYIEEGKHSLERHSNMHLMFDKTSH